jgi:UDP-2,3-diacylglucosamine pyrophosphatase LpxH
MKARSLFISDIHLGTDICQADKLLNFLKSFETEDGHGYNLEYLYLVGDIVDFIALGYKNRWNQKHWEVIQKFLRMSRKNVKLYVIQGNHDHQIGCLVGEEYGNIEFCERIIHLTKKGDTCLVIHGHQFDGAIKSMPWLYWLGDNAYSFALWMNKWFNRARTLFGLKYWSLSLWLKTKVKGAVKFISNFNHMVVDETRKENCNVCISGHIHKAEDTMIEDIRCLNDGCFTEFCSAIIEDEKGNLKLLILED